MCCCYHPGPGDPEFQKRFKPENNSGCQCHGRDSCDYPTRALAGSPLFDFEEKYGRVINKIQWKLIDGRRQMIFSKVFCPEKPKTAHKICCAVRYKIS